MTAKPIVFHPDPRLKKTCEDVTVFGPALTELIQDLADTMYAFGGVGIAASQIGVMQRVCLIDIPERDKAPELRILINPRISFAAGTQRMNEGCLSFPGVFEMIDRAAQILVVTHDLNGKVVEMPASGLLAVVMQHEIDHLNGKVFTERMGGLQRTLALKSKKHRESIV